jgi:succinate dehydrogenase / fumarate reductase flavoprotein subunit
MQGLAEGYFVVPMTIGDYLADQEDDGLETDHAAFRDAERAVEEKTRKLLAVDGSKTVDEFHQALGRLMWNKCGMERSEERLKEALAEIPELRERFWREVRVPGSGDNLNQSLEKAGRVADFLEFAELMCHDALARGESAGAHFRVEHQTEEGEAKRDDENFSFVSVWEFRGVGEEPALHREELEFEYVPPTQRSYK